MWNMWLSVVPQHTHFLANFLSAILLQLRNSCSVVPKSVTITEQNCYVMFHVPKISKYLDIFGTRNSFVAQSVTYVTFSYEMFRNVTNSPFLLHGTST